MTKEEIIEIVIQIGKCEKPENDSPALKIFETFAKLIAEKEREECAKIAEEWALAYPHQSKTIVELIRKRGQE